MRVEQFLSESAARLGSIPAIVAAGRTYSYRELARAAERVAGTLRKRGIRRGDRVALLMDGNFAAVVTTFGALIAGAVICAIDPRRDSVDLQAALSASGAVVLATEARFASAAAAALSAAVSIRLVLLSGGDRSTASGSCLCFEDIIAGIGQAPEVTRAGSASDPAITLDFCQDGSGRTLTLTHAELVAAASATPRQEATVIPRSIFSVHGLCQLLAAIRAGATVVLESSSVFGQSVFGRPDETQAVPVPAV